METQLNAKISFRIGCHNWNNVNATIDLHESEIQCELDHPNGELFKLYFISNEVEVTELSVFYNEIWHEGITNKIRVFYSNLISGESSGEERESDNRKKVKVLFGFHETVISLIPQEKDRNNFLVYSGVNRIRKEFKASVKYKNQNFVFSSPENIDLLTVTSEKPFSDEIETLIHLSFSLYQNAELSLLESHSENEFLLYIQTPPATGTQLCQDKEIFLKIWNWLANDDTYKRQCNAIDFFLAGTRNRGSYLDFRLINLFVCMNSICGKDGKFGENISKKFDISEGDGLWLAYVRNNMVHEGENIVEAIKSAFEEFRAKQKDKKVSRYEVYSDNEHKQKLCSTLYFDTIDLIMAYFMKTIGYDDKPIEKMRKMYGV